MTLRIAARRAAALLLTAPAGVLAHVVHAAPGSFGPWHWHATETFGVVVIAAAAALACWLAGAGK